jgi:antitoxin PrlF
MRPSHHGRKLIQTDTQSAARSSTISSKGQITVPLEIRNRLGLKKGDRVEFVVDNDRTTIRPARAPENPFVKYIGALPAFSIVHEANAWVRTLRDEES